MKKFLNLLFLFVLAATLFTACNNDDIDETELMPVFDCPGLELNIGDICTYTITDPNGDTIIVTSIVNADCECPPSTTVDCPNLNGNIGDPCAAGGLVGTINANCECEGNSGSFDCPNLQLNFGDACTNAAGQIGTVNMSCECEPNPMVDCPNLGLNIGDDCSVINQLGVVNANCECEESNGYDCMDLMQNYGDPCTYIVQGGGLSFTVASFINEDCLCNPNPGDPCISPAGALGTLDANGDCIPNGFFDCPNVNANFGDACFFGMNQMGTINGNCECQEDAIFDCPDLWLNEGDPCQNPIGGIPGIVSANCECI
jgi:hypothetical protein